jgi:hypothetical protein
MATGRAGQPHLIRRMTRFTLLSGVVRQSRARADLREWSSSVNARPAEGRATHGSAAKNVAKTGLWDNVDSIWSEGASILGLGT